MPAVSGIIEFWSASGAPCAQTQIAALIAGSGQDYNRAGFFGAGGPGTYVIVAQYQDTTYIVNENGNPSGAFTASGKLNNLKYVSSSNVNPNSSGSTAVSGIPEHAATIRIEFTQPSGTACQTQNAVFKAVRLNASSGVDDETLMVSGMLIQAFEVIKDTAWTLISQTGAQNYIALDNRTNTTITHDFHVGISISPLQTGERIDFAFLFRLEFI